MIDKLIQFAKKYHPGFEGMPDNSLRRMFETYKDTTVVYEVNGHIRGFAVYQEWPDCLNFIAIAGDGGSTLEAVSIMLAGTKRLPAKPICYFDEKSMELKTICQPRQSPI